MSTEPVVRQRKWVLPTAIAVAAALVLGGVGVVIGLLAQHDSTTEKPGAGAPIVTGPDQSKLHQSCDQGFALPARDGFGTHAGPGTPETSCFFTDSVLRGVLGAVRQRKPAAAIGVGARRRRLCRRARRRMQRLRLPDEVPAVHGRRLDHLHRRAERPGLLVVMRLSGALAAAILVLASALPVIEPPTARASWIEGMSVFLDPGHNGANDASISSQVTDGRGGTKECQTTGTSTSDGYSEHSFNFDVATRVRAALEQMGVHTQMSRSDDASVAACVDQRAAAANAMHPDVDVSIHADGGPSSGHGFHVNYSAPPLNGAQSGPAMQLAGAMRDSMIAAGLQPSTYIGSEGLYGRADLAGLNLAEYPAVLVETGNMRNADEAAAMETAEGRQRYADAITAGIVAYLSRKQ